MLFSRYRLCCSHTLFCCTVLLSSTAFITTTALSSSIGPTTSTVNSSRPANHRTAKISVIGAPMRNHTPLLVALPLTLLAVRAARLTLFPTIVTTIGVSVLSSFWICLCHLDRNSFEFFRVFVSLLRWFVSLHLWPPPLSYLISSSILIMLMFISIDKLDGTNYDTWASDIKLWLRSQVNHLTKCGVDIDENEVFLWLKIDGQLCIVIKSIMHSSLKQIFHFSFL